LIQQANTTVGHRARLFSKMMLNTPIFATKFDFIWTFSHCYLSSPKSVTNH